MAITAQTKGGDKQTIVVVGAGIGGLTAALALSRAGFRVVIAERSDHLSEAGAGIQISPNAGRVLADLGLYDRIAPIAMEPAAIEIRSGRDGEIIASIPGDAFRKRYGSPYLVIHRSDLQLALAATATANPAISLLLGATVAQHLPQPDGLLVRIQKPGGIHVQSAAAIVAADGVWSSFREKIPGSARPAPTRRTAWRAVLAADAAQNLVAMDRVGLWLGRRAHLVHYPIVHGAAVNIVAIVEEQWDKQGWSAVGERADIIARFADWPEAARTLIAAPLAWQKFAINRVNPNGAWTSDRFALLGDAAHAMVPHLAQGAAMAIEDAAVLANTLRDATDIPAALKRYETRRKSRVKRVARAADHAGQQFHYGHLMGFARDAALRFMGEKLVVDRNDWLYRWTASAADDAQPPQ